MTRPVKFLLLFLALALPGLIYVFLKTFGQNEFNVPALYQEGPAPGGNDCPGFVYSVPYAVPDSLLGLMAWKSVAATLIFTDQAVTDQAIDRLSDVFPDGAMDVIVVPDSLRAAAACALALQAPATAAIVDKDKRIRGQYDVTDREETDRLILEMTIILKRYYIKDALDGDN